MKSRLHQYSHSSTTRMYLLSILLLFYTLFPGINGLCQPGCECRDEERRVDCRNITDIPILLHPMLTQLFIRDSPMLRLDPVFIGLYQGRSKKAQKNFLFK